MLAADIWTGVLVALAGVVVGAVASGAVAYVVGRAHANRELRFDTYADALAVLHHSRHNISKLELDPLTAPEDEPSLGQTTSMDARLQLVATAEALAAYRNCLTAAHEFFGPLTFRGSAVIRAGRDHPDDPEKLIAAQEQQRLLNRRAQAFRIAVAGFESVTTREIGGRRLAASRRSKPA